MHNNYSVNVACLCEKNLTSIWRKLNLLPLKCLYWCKHKNDSASNFDAIIVDSEMLNKIPENLAKQLKF